MPDLRNLTLGICSFAILNGCSTMNEKTENNIEKTRDAQTDRNQLIDHWNGKEGYLMVPPTFKTSSAFQAADPDKFRRCEKVKISRINYAYTDHEFTIFLEQNGSTFAIVGLEGKTTDGKTTSDLNNLSENFADKLPDFNPLTVKTAEGTVPTQKLACEGRFWKGMNTNELIFVVGKPTAVARKTANRQALESWSYDNASTGKSSSFSFANGLLQSWKL